ncbi:MAG: molybdopterin-dependent oxidoreductase [Acidimicrobiales bacterium]|nr:molybdopterin-dependent oxidoreductase [Acidimicrobiales bacterium]
MLVDVQDGRATRVIGDRADPVYQGYSCVKGREQHHQLTHPDRLLHSMKRGPDGGYSPIPVERAMDEIAEQLMRIRDDHGPRAIAGYTGTYIITSALNGTFHSGLMRGIGTSMTFTASMIDKPGKPIAKALHGAWMAPQQGYIDPDVALLVGLNPFVAYQGFPLGHPGKWLSGQLARGMTLIVVDPRRSDVAKRATIHLQVRPGQDAVVLAGMLRVILTEDRCDADFVRTHATGVEELRRAVEPFTPDVVASRAGIDADDLVRAARCFAEARRGYAQAGTGPNMHGRGTLNEYLVLCLDTLCGHFSRAGEEIRNPGTLIPTVSAKAQARSPWPAYGFGEHLRVRGLTDTVAGLPTAALPEEILTEGPGQVRALISLNGNPVAAFPDQLLTIEAMQALELLVQIDPWMSQTARFAHYVIAPKMPLEMAGTSFYQDSHLLIGNGYGPLDPHGQYTPAIVSPPPGSEVIEEWEFYYGVATRMGIELSVGGVALDMTHKPTTDDLLELLHRGSRIPLAEVKRFEGGALFREPRVVIAPMDPGWTGRLDVGNAEMMADLRDVSEEVAEAEVDEEGRRIFRLVCRRLTHMMNSAGANLPASNHGKAYNPAFMHPGDLAELGLNNGDVVELRSARAKIVAIVEADSNVRRGVISMAHSFGDVPERDEAYREIGSNTGRLVAIADRYERYSGQPRMSNVPVTVAPLITAATAATSAAARRA